MFFSVHLRRCGFLFFILTISLVSYGQRDFSSVPQLIDQANELIESADYTNALVIYNDLVARYPKDPEINYYTGICLYKTGEDIPGAIENLNFAAEHKDISTVVFYHLGNAYGKNYQFQKAEESYQKFMDVARRRDIRKIQPEKAIRKTRDAAELTSSYRPVEILSSSEFSFKDSSQLEKISVKEKKLKTKSDYFNIEDRPSGKITEYIFTPEEIQAGEYIYFAGYKKNKDEDANLFRIKKLSSQQAWGVPEELKKLNSELDEILPYYDETENSLYFASKGFGNLGGFDIFKSEYNKEKNEWTEPVNLGFPINSTYDEFFAVPDSDNKSFLLVTEREGLDSMLTSYKLIISKSTKSLADADYKEIKKIEDIGTFFTDPLTAKPSDKVSTITRKDVSRSENEKNTMNEGSSPDEMQYQVNIASALTLQKKSDSLSMLAKESRIKVKTMQDPDEKLSLQKKITAWEESSRDYKEKADEIFTSLENTPENKTVYNVSDKEKNSNSSIRKEKEINGIVVYKHNENEPQSDIKKESPKPRTKTPENEIINKTGEFKIMNSSPYNSNNPFPDPAPLPSGAIYKIQIGAFSKEVDYKTFGGLTPITREHVKGKQIMRYFVGEFSKYIEARNALAKVRTEGFSDAFIVGWYNGNKTAVTRLQELEKRDYP